MNTLKLPPRSVMLSEAQVAAWLDIPAGLLRYWRRRGVGPRCCQSIIGLVEYHPVEVVKWRCKPPMDGLGSYADILPSGKYRAVFRDQSGGQWLALLKCFVLLPRNPGKLLIPGCPDVQRPTIDGLTHTGQLVRNMEGFQKFALSEEVRYLAKPRARDPRREVGHHHLDASTIPDDDSLLDAWANTWGYSPRPSGYDMTLYRKLLMRELCKRWCEKWAMPS